MEVLKLGLGFESGGASVVAFAHRAFALHVAE
jgi:hypothetical protein